MANLAGVVLALCILLLGILQGAWSGRNLERDTLRRGRIALSSGDFAVPNEQKNRDNSVRFLLDGDLGTHTQIYFPSLHPEGTHVIAELGLTHLPPAEARPPEPLKPVLLRIYQEEGGAYSRIKKARISILRRRANDPDRENVIPPTEQIWSQELLLNDAPIQEIPVTLPIAQASPRYPEHVYLIIAKIHILEIYPGRDGNRVALQELEYLTETSGGQRYTFTAL